MNWTFQISPGQKAKCFVLICSERKKRVRCSPISWWFGSFQKALLSWDLTVKVQWRVWRFRPPTEENSKTKQDKTEDPVTINKRKREKEFVKRKALIHNFYLCSQLGNLFGKPWSKITHLKFFVLSFSGAFTRTWKQRSQLGWHSDAAT